MYELTGPLHDGSSVESGFEPGAFRPGSRHFTTRTKAFRFVPVSREYIEYPVIMIKLETIWYSPQPNRWDSGCNSESYNRIFTKLVSMEKSRGDGFIRNILLETFPSTPLL
ncbi:hypothetical protein AVEN_42229-1 [Araneus ventricosus]|uniref:Uncharacterized protein n=1 Tax=Araneus ventricosus TaxID=182803 RepID=A0A4Y2AYX3_ARAVE|nr:hypothetical protein AVEN_42229-1 [Araneus ventricosus]